MIVAATLLAGCNSDKENRNDAPLEEQLIGKWVVTEYFDPQTNTYKSAAGTLYEDFYAQLNADKTYTTDLYSGTYVLKNKTIECTYKTTSKFYLDIIEVNGNSAIANYYHSTPDSGRRFKARKQ